MSPAESFFVILVLAIASSTFASPLANCPESAAASRHDQPIIFDSTPPLIPNNDNIIPEAPLLLPPAHTVATPRIPYPDNDSIVPETPLIPSPNNNSIIIPEETPLLPPPAHIAAAPQPEQTVTDEVEPQMQPSSGTNVNENESGGEQLGADNHQFENTNTNTGFAGATRAIGGGIRAQPLVDNTPFDSASTTTNPFTAFSSCVALVILSILL